MVHEIKLKKGNIPDEMFDRTQLLEGIKIETEHTDDLKIAKQIAKAHLTESPDYYKYLKKMEKCMEKHPRGYDEYLSEMMASG